MLLRSSSSSRVKELLKLSCVALPSWALAVTIYKTSCQAALAVCVQAVPLRRFQQRRFTSEPGAELISTPPFVCFFFLSFCFSVCLDDSSDYLECLSENLKNFLPFALLGWVQWEQAVMLAAHVSNAPFMAASHRINYRKLFPWLPGQPRRMALSEALQRALSCSLPSDQLLGGSGRSQLCRGASPSSARVPPPHCPIPRHSRSIASRAALSLRWSLHSSSTLWSGANRSTDVKMSSSSSSSSAGDAQGKPKPASALYKRASLQSSTSPGE